ncbi:MAG: hypothetical protein ABFD54_16385 [Armatimonadota bacterium]
MVRQRERVFRTNLSIEECRERLHREARASFLFPDIRGIKYTWGFRRDKFWLQKTEREQRFPMIQPMLYGSLAQDDHSHGTIVRVHFGTSGLARASTLVMLLMIVAALAYSYSALRRGHWEIAAIIVGLIAQNFASTPRRISMVRRAKAVLIRHFKDLLEAERVRNS